MHLRLFPTALTLCSTSLMLIGYHRITVFSLPSMKWLFMVKAHDLPITRLSFAPAELVQQHRLAGYDLVASSVDNKRITLLQSQGELTAHAACVHAYSLLTDRHELSQ
jgi:hypothetical protein